MYRPELQSVRGIAAVIVLLSHCVSYYVAGSPTRIIWVPWLLNSHAAVVIFFVLSGFVLSSSYKEFSSSGLLKFYIKRAFRIYPALWAACLAGIAYVLILGALASPLSASQWALAQFELVKLTPRIVAASFVGSSNYLVPPGWTIAIELIGSVMIPALAYGSARSLRITLASLGTLTLISFATAGHLPGNIGMYLVDFAAGATLVRAINHPVLRSNFYRILTIISLASLVLIRAVLDTSTKDPYIHFMETVFSSIIVSHVAASTGTLRILNHKYLIFIGDISYSLYLIHFTILFALAKILAIAGYQGGGWTASALVGILTLALSVPIAWALYRWVEKPGIELGRRIASHSTRRGG